MSLATAVRIGESSVRSMARRGVQRPPPSERKSATTSIASVAEPPLPIASSLPPLAEPRAELRRRGEEDPGVVLEGVAAQPADLLGLGEGGAADVVDHRVEVPFGLGEERIEEARRTGVGLGPRFAPLEQSAVVEEDMDQLPEHVVGRLDDLLTNERVLAGRGEAPLRRAPRFGRRRSREPERQRSPVARSSERAGDLLSALLALAEADHDVLGLDQLRGPRRDRSALGGHRERRQRPFADDHRVNELDRDVTGVGSRRRGRPQRDQSPPAREALRHPVTAAGEPLRLAREELPVGLGARPDEARKDRRRLTGVERRAGHHPCGRRRVSERTKP